MPFEISKFVREVLTPLSCPPAAQEFLLRLRFSGGKYSDFAEVLSSLPESEANLLRAANEVFESKLKEKLTNPSVALSMIGFMPARNFLAASMVGGEKHQLLPGNPAIAKMLRYALEGEGSGGEFAQDYFLAGIIYDLLTAELIPVGEVASKPSKTKGSDFINTIWRHSVEVSKAACKISKVLTPEFGLEKDLALDCLLHDLGKVGMHLLYPDEEKNLALRPVAAETRWLDEQNSYGLSHDALGYLILSRLGFLKDAAWVVLCHHQPFLAKKRGKSVLARATLVWLADHLVRFREQHRTKQVTDRMMQNWLKVTQTGIQGCTEKKFKEAISSA